MAAIDNGSTQPNLFELAGEYTRITYSTTSITGQPQFHYQDRQRDVNATGDGIRSQDSEIGTLVTVTLEVIPDLHTLTVTLLVPQINLRGGTGAPSPPWLSCRPITPASVALASSRGRCRPTKRWRSKGLPAWFSSRYGWDSTAEERSGSCRISSTA